mmetsp:Transcript_1047/g.2881  ORF Transcript_1047/g.2881 Transcript_1047/m.2881 type:complete len:198 (-) Transcript_1047:186-779(-)
MAAQPSRGVLIAALVLLLATDASAFRVLRSCAAAGALSVACGLGQPLAAGAADALLSGSVTVQPGVSPPVDERQALYITARPARPDNVPRAVLSGTNGKAPPVLSARIAAPLSFPLSFALTAADETAEGAEGGGAWWQGDNLIVSARLDTDGVAATRDPTDLVGRGMLRRGAGGEGSVEVELQGRGIGGKLVTSKAQ